MRKVGIRQFARHFYTEVQDLPVIVTAKKKPLYIVMAIEEAPAEVKPVVDYPITVNGKELNHIGDTAQIGDSSQPGFIGVTLTGQPIIAGEPTPQSDILNIQDSPTTFLPIPEPVASFRELVPPTVSDQEISDARTNGWTEKLKKKIFG